MFEFYTKIESFNFKSSVTDPDYVMVIDITFHNLYLEKELERIFTTFHIKHAKCCEIL